jgi:hypothetical protein
MTADDRLAGSVAYLDSNSCRLCEGLVFGSGNIGGSGDNTPFFERCFTIHLHEQDSKR